MLKGCEAEAEASPKKNIETGAKAITLTPVYYCESAEASAIANSYLLLELMDGKDKRCGSFFTISNTTIVINQTPCIILIVFV